MNDSFKLLCKQTLIDSLHKSLGEVTNYEAADEDG